MANVKVCPNQPTNQATNRQGKNNMSPTRVVGDIKTNRQGKNNMSPTRVVGDIKTNRQGKKNMSPTIVVGDILRKKDVYIAQEEQLK
ncbi:hypothetical protein DPMN_053182 [Dreissena polymorpha]|uniref:Uncharacterized protein n=1 Tax=Dreissena polymorpha TaxID=45954 RepID=A0A9D4CMJ1_DREPO|nr:hypothetical protein DPMN_053182 [Dreissena polymorpha]